MLKEILTWSWNHIYYPWRIGCVLSIVDKCNRCLSTYFARIICYILTNVDIDHVTLVFNIIVALERVSTKLKLDRDINNEIVQVEELVIEESMIEAILICEANLHLI